MAGHEDLHLWDMQRNPTRLQVEYHKVQIIPAGKGEDSFLVVMPIYGEVEYHDHTAKILYTVILNVFKDHIYAAMWNSHDWIMPMKNTVSPWNLKTKPISSFTLKSCHEIRQSIHGSREETVNFFDVRHSTLQTPSQFNNYPTLLRMLGRGADKGFHKGSRILPLDKDVGKSTDVPNFG